MTIRRTGKRFELNEFLARPLFAHLATASPDGPRESPIWFHWEDGALWFIGTTKDSWPRRLRAEPRCAIGIVDFDLARGFLQHVGMRGTAKVGALDVERFHRLLHRYLGQQGGWNPWFRENVIRDVDLMVRFTPATTVMHDQSYFR